MILVLLILVLAACQAPPPRDFQLARATAERYFAALESGSRSAVDDLVLPSALGSRSQRDEMIDSDLARFGGAAIQPDSLEYHSDQPGHGQVTGRFITDPTTYIWSLTWDGDQWWVSSVGLTSTALQVLRRRSAAASGAPLAMLAAGGRR